MEFNMASRLCGVLLLCVVCLYRPCFSCGEEAESQGVNPPSAAACPCSNPAWCDPIKTISKNELLVFGGGADWPHYFWDNFTTLAVLSGFDPQIMCKAHSKGVRIVIFGTFSPKTLFNETARNEWIANTVKEAQASFTDGYNIDFESPITYQQAPVLTQMVKDIRDAFRKVLPYSQITFDAPYTPNCYGIGRCFDYPAIAELVDYILIMGYDEVNFFSPIANANDPFEKTAGGVDAFIKAGVSPSKLVLAVPWYGYDFACHIVTPENECFYIPFTEGQIHFGNISLLLANNSTTGRLWSEKDQCPYFNYKTEANSTTKIHQIWYDDHISLSQRFAFAKNRSLYGVSVFNADALDYSTHQKAVNETNEMWDAFIYTFKP